MGRSAKRYLMVCLAVLAVGDGNWTSADQSTSSTHLISQRQPPLEATVEQEQPVTDATEKAVQTVEEKTVERQAATKLVNLGPTVNSSFNDGAPALSTDGLTLIFHSNRPSGQGMADLWMCTRAALSKPFGKPVNLGPTVNSSFQEYAPALSGDGLTLLFWSGGRRPGGEGGNDLWMCTRAALNKPFCKPVNLGPTVNSRFGESSPTVSADGLFLLFASDRPGGQGKNDLWMCMRKSPSEPFGRPGNPGTIVNSGFSDTAPAISSDGRTLIFRSTRPGGQGLGDLWMLTK